MVTPPVAPTRPHVRHLHGRDIPDDFAWMADGGDDLTDYLRAELDHCAAATAPLEPLAASALHRDGRPDAAG